MGASRQVLVRTLAVLGVVLALPGVAESQVGIPSGLVQVALVAHVAPRGSIQNVSAERETGRMGSVREALVTVRVAANTGYQLVVRGSAVAGSRIWVRGVNGEFQELTAGSSVTVARGTRAAGQWDREVQYRIESAGDLKSLPVRYEIAINPTL
ncbi:MAG TPA: hypothetical protein VGR09_13475 [Gemmatimonadales bacterium]|nr:hypothetical protein [Gemmatimonadales bacterium]